MCIILSDWDSSHAPSVDHLNGMQMSLNGKAEDPQQLGLFSVEVGISPKAALVIIKNAQLLVLPPSPVQSRPVVQSCVASTQLASGRELK